MKKPFKEGSYLNAWGAAFVAIQLGKTPKGISDIYKSGLLKRKITKARAKKWNHLWKSFREK